MLEPDFDSPQFTPIEIAALVLSQEAILAGGSVSYDSPFAEAGKSLINKVRSKMPAQKIFSTHVEMNRVAAPVSEPTQNFLYACGDIANALVAVLSDCWKGCKTTVINTMLNNALP